MPYEKVYESYLSYCKEFKLIFEKYILNAPKNKIIIHCEGGKDRTGIIIALLLNLLGVQRELIIEDYLLSYDTTKREYIEEFFKILDEKYDGVINYLTSFCHIPMEIINKIKNNLLKSS
ncbi:MAG: tyrosine-protein phosphatase [Promethearchaeota archaeon]